MRDDIVVLICKLDSYKHHGIFIQYIGNFIE